MARVEWNTPGDYHHGDPPWSKKKRNVPLRTYSGSVVYKRSRRSFTQTDLDRISKTVAISIPPNTGIDWQRELILFLQRVTIRMLEKILPFLSEESLSDLYYFVYEVLGNFFGVDTGYILDNRKESIIFSIIERLATLGRFDVKITRRQ
jgi:hypothetical protein